MTPTVSVSIQGLNAPDAVSQIQLAEQSGIRMAWSTIGGAGGADPLTTYAAALSATDRISLGTAIIPTWPRHPVILAHQALALDQLAPGRFVLGIGPSHEPAMTTGFGVEWKKPLTNLREYLVTIRALLQDGAVDYDGQHVTAHARIGRPNPVPLMASALRPGSYELCGELADGAISWMSPWTYLLEEALPAIQRGAERASRDAPPLIAHVPIAVDEDREAAHERARRQLGRYATVPFYRAMFERAGHPGVADGYSSELLDDLVVTGTEEQVAERLAAMLEQGAGEVLAAPLIDNDRREDSIAEAFAAVARADAIAAA